jgi:hypothetical protein
MPYRRDLRGPANVTSSNDAFASMVSRVAKGEPSALSPDVIPGPALLREAASILARQVASNPASSAAVPRLDAPFIGPSANAGGIDLEQFRRVAHEAIEMLLALVVPKAPAGDASDRVPLLRMPAPAKPGEEVSMPLRVANEESVATEVVPYCSNFVSDSGFEIPSLRVSFSPHAITIAPKGEATFDVKVAVPTQAPRGLYSGLVQAAGLIYVKAVITVEVQ